MKRISLIVVVFAVSCIILSQGGCKEAEKSAPAVQTPVKSRRLPRPINPLLSRLLLSLRPINRAVW